MYSQAPVLYFRGVQKSGWVQENWFAVLEPERHIHKQEIAVLKIVSKIT
jgi:hypothetical protein